ncbi:MAG: glycosyltransferase family 4 protein, partial [Bacteroidota bacterium]
NAKAIHLLGRTNYDHLNNLIYVNNKVLIPNGINIDSIPELTKRREDEILFGTCSRIDIHMKGLDTLLKGFAQYCREGGNGALQLIGDGEELDQLKWMAVDLKIAPRVRFLGAKYDLEKFECLNRVDCFTQPSRNEGFPISVLEAAAMRIPCLVSEETNVGSFIRQHEAGFVLQKNTPEELAKEMHKAQHLYDAGRLSMLGLNARQMVRDRFTWESIAQEFIELYEMPLDQWRIRQSEKYKKQMA